MTTTTTTSTPGSDAPAATSAPALVRFSSVTKLYGGGESAVTALHEVSLDLPKGSFTAVMGPSGSGKSTFLHCAAGLDRPTSGSVHLAGVGLGDLDEEALTRLRREAGAVSVASSILTMRDSSPRMSS